jgi:hypothetical protein
MLTQDESPAPALAEVSGTSRKLFELLRRRLRQLARVAFVLLVCLALAAAAVAIWWLRSLDGLPDIGDPFDVAAFRAFRIPDDRNAFTSFRRAWETLTPLPPAGLPSEVARSEMDPRLLAWIEANRPAVELFIKGAAQADGISGPAGERLAGEGNSHEYPLQASGWLPMWLTILEGRRRAEGGDTAGAWDCYRAVLRMAAHVRRRERLQDRERINRFHLVSLRQLLATWASDPRTTIPQLRRALEEVVECRPRPEWDTFTLRTEYLDLMRFLDWPINPPPEQVEEELTFRLGDLELPADQALQVYRARLLLLREPDRSRRVVRLLFANWLAQAENPDPQRRRPAVRARFHIAKRTNSFYLYPVGPEAPAGARALSPREVARWLVATNDAKLALRYVNWPAVRQAEDRDYRELLVILGSELYRRDRGAPPPSEAALVGTYLESLPDVDSGTSDVEMTPTVSDSDDPVGASPK